MPRSSHLHNACIASCARASAWREALGLLERCSGGEALEVVGDTIWKILGDFMGYSDGLKLRMPAASRPNSRFGAAAFALRFRGDKALELLMQMQQGRLQPDFVVRTAVATACERAFMWEVALQLLPAAPDAVAMGALASALAKGARWSDALHLWSRACTHGTVEPNVKMAGAVVSACERAEQWTRALSIFGQMLKEAQLAGPAPDMPVADSVLRACSRGLTWEVACSGCHKFAGLRPVPWLMDRRDLALELDGFNLYTTDAEDRSENGGLADPASRGVLWRRARYGLLVMLVVLGFIGLVWIFDGILDWMDAGNELKGRVEAQGIMGKAATLSCTYIPTYLYDAWRAVQGLPVSQNEIALQGVTWISGATTMKYLRHLPESLEHLTFGSGFSQSLARVTLPSSLRTLTFGYSFDQSLEGVTLPRSLETLTLGSRFNKSLEGVPLPSSLETLTFGSRFNQSLEGVTLPGSLQTLTFGSGFDQSLERVTLPSSLQTLTFGDTFNQSLEGVTLPSSLQTLTFGHTFDQSLEGVTLPSSLQALTFGFEFNQSLEGVSLPSRVSLPSSLQTLTFGSDFDQSLERVTLPSSLRTLTLGSRLRTLTLGNRLILPSGLETLTFGSRFNQSLARVTLPSSLQTLTFGSHFNQSLEEVTLPGSLQTLTFGCDFDQSLERVTLPSSLQTLTFGDTFDQSLEAVTLPSTLKTLTFGHAFNQSLKNETLPSSLQTLTFGYCFNQSLARVSFPRGLRIVTFGSWFNQSLEGVTLPSSLRTLTFGYCFNESLERVSLPRSLQTLTFGDKFNQSLEGVTLPSSLQTLTFGDTFDQSLDRVTLPSSLETLTFGSRFNQSLEGVTLPGSLQTLTFGSDFDQSLERVTLPSSLRTLTELEMRRKTEKVEGVEEVKKQAEDRHRIYFQTCDRKDANGSTCVPNCLAKDVDRGVSRSSFEDEYSSWERECITVPSLSPDFGSRCGTQLSAVSAPLELPLEVELRQSPYEWTAKRSEVIYLELWGGGGGGAGPTHVPTGAFTPSDAWICGGGGGAAAAVSLTWKLEKGQKYRIEIGRGGPPGSAGGATRFLHGHSVVAAAGGGAGAPSALHGALRFAPGGRGGSGGSVAKEVDVVPGMDGQSSRSSLRLPPEILPIDPGAWHSGIPQANKSFTRLPCTGRPGGSCLHKPDFFLVCSTELGCSGCIQNSSSASPVGAEDLKVFREGQLFRGEVAGGTAASGSGGVFRNAGHGGNGQCSAVRVLGKQQRRVQVVPTQGAAGRPGLVSIRSCGRTWSDWSAVKKVEVEVVGMWYAQ
eukprot:s2736_g8.t1